MTDIASLGIKVTSDGIAKAETDLEKLTVAGAEAEKAAGSTGAAWAKASAQISSNTGTIVSELQALNKTQSAALSVAESIKSSFDGLSVQLEKVSGSFAKVDTASASSAKAIDAVGESSDAATARIKDMVKASLAQADAQAEVLGSAKASAEAQATVSAGYDRVIAAQNKAMGATTKIVAEQEKANAAAKNTAGLKQQQEDLAKLIGQIDPAVAALGRLDAQQEKLAAFRKSGAISSDDFKAYSASIDEAREKITSASGAVHSFSLNNANARRELGYLAKDLATGQFGRFEQSALSLANASGVLSFAFSGVGLVVGGIVGVLGLVAAAFVKGEAETTAYNKALILTGNYAGESADQLGAMAKSIAGTVGTTHEAADAIAQVAASGKFVGSQISTVATAALELEKTTGQSIGETIKQFSALADDPVTAIVKLNETQHFLTDAVYEQIKALDAQGKSQEAATLAQSTYASTISDTTSKVQANLGLIEKAWNGITGATKAAVSAALSVGRDQSNQDKFDTLSENRDAAKNRIDRGRGDESFLGTTAQKYYDDATAKMAKLQDDYVAAQKAANTAAAKQEANDLAISLGQDAEKYASAEDKRAKEIAAAHGKANAAIAKLNAVSDAKLIDQIRDDEDKVVAGIESREKKPKKAKQDPEIAAYKTFSGQVDALDVRAITNDDPALTKYQQGIAKLGNELNDYMQKNGDATKAAALFNQGQQALQRTLDQDYKKQQDANDAYSAALDKKNAALQLASDNQVAQVSMGAKEYAQQQQIAKVYRDQADALTNLAIQRQKGIDGQQGGISQSQYDFDVDSVQKHSDEAVAILKNGYAAVDVAQGDWKNGALRAYDEINDKASNVAGSTASLFTNAFDSMADSLATFATTGKLNFKSLATSILSDLAKIAIKIAASQALQAIIGSVAGGSGGGGGDINALGSAGNTGYLTANAKGGVYDSPSLAKFSNQVVSKPTMFAFAKGGALGVMGEVPGKSEAIMPLARGSDGSLGVTVHGGSDAGFNINVVVNVASDGSASTDVSGGNQVLGKQFGDAMANAARKVVAQEIRPGGQIYAAMGRK